MVTQRKKPKSLTSEFEDLEKELKNRSPENVNIEDLLMTEQVVHSFPNDSKNKVQAFSGLKDLDLEVDDDTKQVLTKFKEKIPEVVPDEPMPETTPIFKPKQRITIRKKRDDDEGDTFSTSTQHVIASTPTRRSVRATPKSSHKGSVNGSVDLFSDNSLIEDEENERRPALCEQYGRHTVVHCSPRCVI